MMRWVKQATVPVVGRWSSRPAIDWLIVSVVVGVHYVAIWRGWVSFELSDLAQADRMRLYQTVATVSSLLFGFATASIAFFYGSAKGDRLDLLKKVMSEQLVRTWKASLGAPLLAVAVTCVALAADTPATGHRWVAVAVESALVMLALRAMRLRWLFTQTLSLLSVDIQSPNHRAELPASSGGAVEHPRRKAHRADSPIS